MGGDEKLRNCHGHCENIRGVKNYGHMHHESEWHC
jgi:hypothetical protein